MDKTGKALLLLRPVTFHYRRTAKAHTIGLIAEEVAVNPTGVE
jgi:hypothetical protein